MISYEKSGFFVTESAFFRFPEHILKQNKLLFIAKTSLVKGRGTIAILAMVEGFIIKNTYN